MQFRTIFVARADNDHIGVRRILRFNSDCILRRIELRGKRIVGIDDGSIHIIERPRQLGSLNLNNLHMLGIVDNVSWRSQNASFRTNLQNTDSFKYLQRTAAIGRIVRHGDLCAVRQVCNVLNRLGINAHRFKVNRGEYSEVQFVFLRERIQIGLMLEEVGIELLLRKCQIGLHVVVELNHFDLYAFLLQRRRDEVDDVGVRHGRNADLQFDGGGLSRSGRFFSRSLIAAAGERKDEAAGNGESGKEFFQLHEVCPLENPLLHC